MHTIFMAVFVCGFIGIAGFFISVAVSLGGSSFNRISERAGFDSVDARTAGWLTSRTRAEDDSDTAIRHANGEAPRNGRMARTNKSTAVGGPRTSPPGARARTLASSVEIEDRTTPAIVLIPDSAAVICG